MGLILEADGSYQVLTDILGTEDSLGDMDLKVCQGREGGGKGGGGGRGMVGYVKGWEGKVLL
jgi:hypothetical protein